MQACLWISCGVTQMYNNAALYAACNFMQTQMQLTLSNQEPKADMLAISTLHCIQTQLSSIKHPAMHQS
eukprot:107067-Ditylum_brightwellii.AAC.1